MELASLGNAPTAGGSTSVTKLSSQRVNNIFTHLRKVAQHPLLVRNHYTDEDVSATVPPPQHTFHNTLVYTVCGVRIPCTTCMRSVRNHYTGEDVSANASTPPRFLAKFAYP